MISEEFQSTAMCSHVFAHRSHRSTSLLDLDYSQSRIRGCPNGIETRNGT